MDAEKPVAGAEEDAAPRPDLRTRGWHRRFGQQYVALVYKNVLVATRNWQATAARAVIAPFIFIALIWVVNEALTTNNPNFDPNRSVPNPKPERVASIPDCASNIFVKTPCLDFVYAPTGDTDIEAIVGGIRNNNPGRPIPASQVRGFASREAANAYEKANPETVTGGLFFSRQSGGNIGFVLQTNSTALNFHGVYLDPNLEIQVPLQVAAEREIARSYFAATSGRMLAASDWNVNITDFAHPPVDDYSLEGTLTGPFVFAGCMFAFVLVMGAVVAERELKLRQALRTMGMMDSAFWLSWMSFEMVLGAITALLLAGFGAMWQFTLFRRNNFGLLFFLFWLFQIAMSSTAFLLSTMVSKASTAVNLGFVVFVVGWIVQTIVQFGYPFTPDYVGDIPFVTLLFALCPWALLSKGFNDLGLAASGTNPGLSWSERNSYCKNLNFAQQQDAPYTPGRYVNYDCVLPLGGILWILVAEWLLYFLLAIYLDNVLANESGVRQRPWYFLLPSYWGLGGRGMFRRKHRDGMMATTMGRQRLRPQLGGKAACPQDGEELDPDVAAEAAEVKALAQHRTGRAGSLAGDAEADASQLAGLAAGAVEVFGLQKVFGASWTMKLKPWRWCGSRKQQDARQFWALKGPWFRIPRGQLFCLLGPNGAGKTTTINCLTGVLPASGGDALVFGEALSAPGGMDRIRSRMGVCPQFDILWKELTGHEHLHIYGAVKGIPRKQVKSQAAQLLSRVKLTEAATVRSGAYSGGMKRRLSVAIAMLGDPEVVYLDEPTTGMDPISRRFVWDIIEESKPGRAIVLTTHSMEEADILGDRIAIMARGQLRALGSSLRLKQRFGSGYQISVSVAAPKGSASVGSNLAGLAASPTSQPTADGGLPNGNSPAPGTGSAPANGTSSSAHGIGKTLADGNSSAHGSAPADGSAGSSSRDPEQAARTARVKAFFQQQLDLQPSDETRAYVQFLVPRELESRLPGFLEALERNAPTLGVTDIQIALSQLEEVFLRVALKAEAEAAAAEGSKIEIPLDSGCTLVVTPGQDTARDSAGERLYALTWAQDADGALSVASWREVDEAAAGTADDGATTGPALARTSVAAPNGAAL